MSICELKPKENPVSCETYYLLVLPNYIKRVGQGRGLDSYIGSERSNVRGKDLRAHGEKVIGMR